MQTLKQVAKAHRYAVMQPQPITERQALDAAIDRANAQTRAPASLIALQMLYTVCLGMDAENQMERPTEEEYQCAMLVAAAAIADATGAA